MKMEIFLKSSDEQTLAIFAPFQRKQPDPYLSPHFDTPYSRREVFAQYLRAKSESKKQATAKTNDTKV